MSRLKDKYTSEVAPALKETFKYSSVMQIPKIEKIVLNMGSDRKTLANIRLKKAPMLMPLLSRSSPLPWNVNCWRSGKWRKAVSLPDGLSM